MRGMLCLLTEDGDANPFSVLCTVCSMVEDLRQKAGWVASSMVQRCDGNPTLACVGCGHTFNPWAEETKDDAALWLDRIQSLPMEGRANLEAYLVRMGDKMVAAAQEVTDKAALVKLMTALRMACERHGVTFNAMAQLSIRAQVLLGSKT